MIESLLALNALPKIGPVRIRRLLAHFGSAEAVLAASENALLKVESIGPESAKIIRNAESLTDPAAELAELRERGISLLVPEDSLFPSSLRDIYDCPILLYVWGEIIPRDVHAISIVGTRRASFYGKKCAKKLAYQLAHAGYTIVSGLARGIDTAAHEAALAAGGRTIGVIGSGLAHLYPPENLMLAQKIADGHGAVVSEFPLHTAPDKRTFPQRNRIVAAWPKALVVAESPSWSGSLITANLAAEYGRTVYAVPGPVDQPTSSGCHKLIRNGATLLTSAEELLDDLGLLPLAGVPTPAATPDSTAPPMELPPEEQVIFQAMEGEATGIDELVERTGLAAATVSTCLLKLEMKSLVQALPGFRYTRR